MILSSSPNAISIKSFYESSSDAVVESDCCVIDDTVVTELHEALQMLPCAFPSSEYYEMNKMSAPATRIQPRSDANRYTKQLQFRRVKCTEMTSRMKQARNGKKKQGRKKRKQEKAVVATAQESEAKVLDSIKSLFRDDVCAMSDVSSPSKNLRKRKRTEMTPPKTVNILKAKEEIEKRRVATRSSSESPSVETSTTTPTTTRSGRVVNNPKQFSF